MIPFGILLTAVVTFLGQDQKTRIYTFYYGSGNNTWIINENAPLNCGMTAYIVVIGKLYLP